MKTLTRITTLILLFISTIAYTQSDNQIIVQIYKHGEVEDLTTSHQLYKGQNTGLHIQMLISKQLNIWLLEFDPEKANVRDLLTDIKKSPVVQAAQLNYPVQHRAVPNDASYSAQWQYDNDGLEDRVSDADIDAPLAWDITTGGTTAMGDEIVVAVIDSGVDLTHPDLVNTIWRNPHETLNGIDDDNNGYIDDIRAWNFRDSFYGNDIGNAGAGSGHGTAVAGIIGAEGNNGVGVTGVNWNVKVMNLTIDLNDADVLAAYAYILDMRTRYNQTNGAEGAFVVSTNASLGRAPNGTNEDEIWCSMYDALGEVGIISAVATDNRLFNVDELGDIPSGCPSDYLISVTNTDARDRKVVSAGYGLLSIDLGAPGDGTVTVGNLGDITSFGGASASSPHVAGAVGLLYSAPIPELMDDVHENPREAARRVKNFILEGVDQLPDLQDITVTGGRLNLYNSLLQMEEYYNIPQGLAPTGAIFINTVSPNPATDKVEVEIQLYDTTFLSLKISNGLGQEVHRQSFGKVDRGTHRKTLSLESLPQGIYFITTVAHSFGNIAVEKIIVGN